MPRAAAHRLKPYNAHNDAPALQALDAHSFCQRPPLGRLSWPNCFMSPFVFRGYPNLLSRKI
jgi:hypothetical protein